MNLNDLQLDSQTEWINCFIPGIVAQLSDYCVANAAIEQFECQIGMAPPLSSSFHGIYLDSYLTFT
jgi:hypothetical protein